MGSLSQGSPSIWGGLHLGSPYWRKTPMWAVASEKCAVKALRRVLARLSESTKIVDSMRSQLIDSEHRVRKLSTRSMDPKP